MRLVRLLSVAGFVLLGATWLQADDVEPGHFTVDLNNPGSDTGGWLAPNGSSLTLTDTLNYNPANFNSLGSNVTCGEEWNWWWNWWHEDLDMNQCDDWDPYILLNPGGHSNPFPSSITAIDGGGVFDYYNAGGPITSILFTVSNFPAGQYVCGGTLFDHCGFSTNGTTLEVLFWDNPGDFVPSAVPEPSEGILLVIAAGAMIAGRKFFARKASA